MKQQTKIRVAESKKGVAPQSYIDGKIQQYNFKNRTKEELAEFARKGSETKRKNKEKKERMMSLSFVLRNLLNMKISERKQREILKNMGFTDEDLTNETLIMVALFRKSLTGDVSAIREVVEMMNKLDAFTHGEKVAQQGITINIVQSESDNTSIEAEQENAEDIWKAENGLPFEDNEGEDDWGTDIYNG